MNKHAYERPSHHSGALALVLSLSPVTFYAIAEPLRRLWVALAPPVSGLQESMNELFFGGLILIAALASALVCIPVAMTFSIRVLRQRQSGRAAAIIALVVSSLGLVVMICLAVFVIVAIV